MVHTTAPDWTISKPKYSLHIRSINGPFVLIKAFSRESKCDSLRGSLNEIIIFFSFLTVLPNRIRFKRRLIKRNIYALLLRIWGVGAWQIASLETNYFALTLFELVLCLGRRFYLNKGLLGMFCCSVDVLCLVTYFRLSPRIVSVHRLCCKMPLSLLI